MRLLKFVVLLMSLTVSTVLAQDNPSVAIVPEQTVIESGDIVNADIMVRNGVNVGGIDIGITVDENCLRILEREPGGYLPTTDAEGAFSPFSELNDHDTRLAAASTDRTKYVNGDGVFYTVQLEAICDEGVAPLTVSYAQVSSYVDPTAEIIDVVSYDLDEDTLTATDAQIEIVVGAGSAEEPTVVVTDTGDEDTDTQPDVEPTVTVEATPDTATEAAEQDSGISVIAIVLILVGVVGLIGLFLFGRRRSV